MNQDNLTRLSSEDLLEMHRDIERNCTSAINRLNGLAQAAMAMGDLDSAADYKLAKRELVKKHNLAVVAINSLTAKVAA